MPNKGGAGLNGADAVLCKSLFSWIAADPDVASRPRSGLLGSEGEYREGARVGRVEKGGAPPAETREPCLIARTTTELVVVPNGLRFVLFGVGVDVGDEPHPRVRDTLLFQGRKDLEQKVLRDIRASLMAFIRGGVVPRKTFHVPDPGGGGVLLQPLNESRVQSARPRISPEGLPERSHSTASSRRSSC